MIDRKFDQSIREIVFHGWFDKPNMTDDQKRKLEMLRPLHAACMACTMCRLGRQEHIHRGNKIDQPHVFSNMNPSRYVVIGQNPGYNECVEGEPFVGDAGEVFNEQIELNGLSRDKFYITNTVKCHTPENRAPELDEVSICEPFLRMELKVLRPVLVISLGAVAFNILCPDKKYSDSLGTVVESRFEVKVFPVYHPSPRNMTDPSRKRKFSEDIAKMCALIKKYDELKPEAAAQAQ